MPARVDVVPRPTARLAGHGPRLAPFHLPTARHYLDFIRPSANPIQQILGRLSHQAADAAWAEMKERPGVFTTPGGWVGPDELLLTATRR